MFTERSSRKSLTWNGAGPEQELVWNLTEPKEQIKIAVTGISRGAGTTFVSVSLAFLLASVETEKQHRREERYLQTGSISPARVSYLELRRPQPGESMVYYSASLDRRFQGRRFTDFFSLYLQGKMLPRTANLHKGINWVVWRHPERSRTAVEPGVGADWEKTDSAVQVADFPLDQMPGEYIVADSPALETLGKYDLVIGVIDSLPSAVYAGSAAYEQLRDMEMAGLPVIWLVNKDSPEVNHLSLKRYLKLKEYFAVPELDRGLFCKAQYSGRLPVEILVEAEKNTPGHEPGVLEDLKNAIMQQLLQK